MKRKPVHPIRAMQRDLTRLFISEMDTPKEAAIIARHVKPLLDALEEAKKDIAAGECDHTEERIEEILAKWRAKP